jgi:hypothetical protein
MSAHPAAESRRRRVPMPVLIVLVSMAAALLVVGAATRQAAQNRLASEVAALDATTAEVADARSSVSRAEREASAASEELAGMGAAAAAISGAAEAMLAIAVVEQDLDEQIADNLEAEADAFLRGDLSTMNALIDEANRLVVQSNENLEQLWDVSAGVGQRARPPVQKA